jgi:CRP-like cAMP-binding protein
MKALIFGAFTAISLPVGALLAVWLRPSNKITGGVMAFGAGALIAALTFELVSSAIERAGFIYMGLGTAAGSVIFFSLNQALNNRGGFMRKASTLKTHLLMQNRKKIGKLVGEMSEIEILVRMPPEVIYAIIPHVHLRTYQKGAAIFRQGDAGDALYFIDEGKAGVSRKAEGGAGNSGGDVVLGPGSTFGEIALLTGEPRNATVTALEQVKAWKIHRNEFMKLMNMSEELRDAVSELAGKRVHEDADAKSTEKVKANWRREVLRHAHHDAVSPTPMDVKEAVHEQKAAGGAAMAIMLGAFLDGIPESLIVGAGIVGAAVSMSLVAGIFISNLPESMSSAVMMKKQGARTSRIMSLWMILVVVSALSAMAGNVLLAGADPRIFALCEGAAAGAMLTMIAQTMLPEAYENGSFLIGLLTVLGFLTAIYIHSIQKEPVGKKEESYLRKAPAAVVCGAKGIFDINRNVSEMLYVPDSGGGATFLVSE